MLKRAKKNLKWFKPEWFSVEDVEEFYRIILDKYELIDKEKVLRPDPKDIGKKHFLCNRCDMKWWTKKKPKRCSKCGSKEIEQYFRV